MSSILGGMNKEEVCSNRTQPRTHGAHGAAKIERHTYIISKTHNVLIIIVAFLFVYFSILVAVGPYNTV